MPAGGGGVARGVRSCGTGENPWRRRGAGPAAGLVGRSGAQFSSPTATSQVRRCHGEPRARHHACHARL